MTPKAVVFDIGNVLIEWQPERYFDSLIGEVQRRALFTDVDLHTMNDRVDSGENFTSVLLETAASFPLWSHEVNHWHDNWLAIASPVIEHSVRLMAALQGKGVPVFSLTNFGIETYAIAATKYHFLHGFDRDFISGHMGVVKPDPQIYQMLEAGSGLSGDALLFADDRPENIAAASMRGWQTHLFETPQGWADRLVAAGLLNKEEAQ
ncbi:HAD family hydrolase [Sulfitobacter guttiformis]|uniref:2-haloacid dehalogenase n=1 Tax=Sulfitobacter guttiformis TaxID=74349 RepID=A0A420DSX1_9RHOB|nr:HAD family phosphatase [Sulfitobacter guttiformis]KIN74664.1 Hydrolase [Sulfitobacter guttiformis KCTC 32187]RKE97239.1 2-haloacid dehalogenase [Sulfitobacter guttiformis]